MPKVWERRRVKKYRMLGITSGIGSMMAPALEEELKEKIEIVGNQEWREYYNCGVFEQNFHAPYWDDWNDVPSEAKEDIDIVMGHPECGNFSILNNDITKRKNENDIGDFVEKVSEVQPKFFLMDDLYPSLAVYPSSWYHELLPDYDLFFEPISNYHYGNIQKSRKRFFVVGAKRDLKFTFIPGENVDHNKTVWDIIGDLPEEDLPEIQHIHVPKDGEARSWKNPGEEVYCTWEELARRFKDLSPGKNLPYTNKKGEDKVRIGYVRLYKDKHSHVLYGGGAQGYPGAFHPETGLPLTVRERARIQGFPDSFSFELSEDLDPAQKQLIEVKATGKAMPLQFCGYAMRQFVAHLEGRLDFDEATGSRLYGNIPGLITSEKERYCQIAGYSFQDKACQHCWHKRECQTRLRRITEDLLEF